MRVGDFVRSDPMIEHVRQDRGLYRVLPLTGTIYDRNYLPMFGLETANGFYDNRIRYYDTLVGEGFRNLLNSNIMRIANVKYLLTAQPIEHPLLYLERDMGRAYIYRNRDFLPRAYLVHRAVVAESDSAALALMRTAAFDPAAEVVLASGTALEGGPPGGDERVSIDDYDLGRVRVRAKAEAPGYLCFSANWLPYWSAYVDGEETEVLRCNIAMRAVPLDAGEHVIEMKYESRWFRIGSYLCLASCLFVAGSVVVCSGGWPFVRRRKKDG
jgi:hypothetical protein